MSGGSFDHAYRRVESFAEELEKLLASKGDLLTDEKVRSRLKHVLNLSRKTAKAMKDTEWFFSYDIDEEEFLKRTNRVLGTKFA